MGSSKPTLGVPKRLERRLVSRYVHPHIHSSNTSDKGWKPRSVHRWTNEQNVITHTHTRCRITEPEHEALTDTATWMDLEDMFETSARHRRADTVSLHSGVPEESVQTQRVDGGAGAGEGRSFSKSTTLASGSF